jgi:hypothetical protein
MLWKYFSLLLKMALDSPKNESLDSNLEFLLMLGHSWALHTIPYLHVVKNLIKQVT